MTRIIASIFIIGLVVYGVITSYLDSKEAEPFPAQAASDMVLTKGGVAPLFSLTNLQGEQVSLQELKGTKVILNFWATWCPPCKEEMPEMQKFYEENKDNDVIVLAVNATQTEIRASDVQDFVNEYELTFPILLDEEGIVNTDMYHVVTLPTTFFIDSNGIMQQQVLGSITYEQMKSITESLD
ncbi:TlpA disulfide reductase family protein [Bacillus solimangrovi]|uniref:Thioredoxin domain-containing protein n=1 Tax=Bacillus solimangrovi TaxID=1305675 RepID=A0A1E5LEJ2_9BACI|nr:TlpA disulfide reductase family protein [Bacillus solimangrovi]OEH92485.1 hypothetical protein BFG57_15625 [Bacillus solimangrovi]